MMNIKVILIVASMLICVPAVSAMSYCYDNGDHEGVYTHQTRVGNVQLIYYGCGENLYVDWYAQDSGSGTGSYRTRRTNAAGCSGSFWTLQTYYSPNHKTQAINTATTRGMSLQAQQAGSPYNHFPYFIMIVRDGTTYTISGNVSCVDESQLYIYNGTDYIYLESDTGDTYSFTVHNASYKIVFEDTMHTYMFTVNGSNIIYDYDACIYTHYRFEEKCGNLIPDSEGGYFFYKEDTIDAVQFYESDGILDISDVGNKLDIYAYTFMGYNGWLIDPIVANTTYTLQNPYINWWLKVIVQNATDGTLLNGAMVNINQSCYCTPDYFTAHKKTVNGIAYFDGMSLQDASIHVSVAGYKFLDDNTTGYQATLSGRSNFSGKTWVIKLAPSNSENESERYEVSNKVDIHFRSIAGNRTSKISDTDASVRLYYENNNSDNEAMTLKFQSSSTNTYFNDELSWSIPYDEIGYKTIANEYFTPWDYSYRAIMYNSSIYGWNITAPLTVRNNTKEIEQHYQNLTTSLWFMYSSAGKIDYRDNMNIGVHAESNNTTLMTIDVELWKDGVYQACKNLTATDFITASLPYYVVWEPSYSYVSGSNYSIRMYGFDRTLLETDYVECYTDTVTRRNKLTIIVKSQSGSNLRNSFIFLEGWGQLETGSNYYNSYEGLENGTYRYKASKSGYDGAGWDEIVIADDDEIVTYILTSQTSAASHTSAKMSDSDVKEIFFPCMFALLIFIVLGGFKYVLK